jgi:hypothetical protein
MKIGIMLRPYGAQRKLDEVGYGQNRGILIRVRLSWTCRVEVALQTMAGILHNFVDVSFYAFTHTYSLFTLLFSE